MRSAFVLPPIDSPSFMPRLAVCIWILMKISNSLSFSASFILLTLPLLFSYSYCQRVSLICCLKVHSLLQLSCMSRLTNVKEKNKTAASNKKVRKALPFLSHFSCLSLSVFFSLFLSLPTLTHRKLWSYRLLFTVFVTKKKNVMEFFPLPCITLYV